MENSLHPQHQIWTIFSISLYLTSQARSSSRTSWTSRTCRRSSCRTASTGSSTSAPSSAQSGRTMSPSPSGSTLKASVVLERILKFRNRDLRFLLPVREMGNWESENDSSSIPFTIPLIQILVPIPPNYRMELEMQFLGIVPQLRRVSKRGLC